MNNNQTILLVEDDKVDAMTVIRAFKELNITNPLHREENGEEALQYLKNIGKEKPCIILLDINMPKMNGIELLKVLKKEDDFKRIPVVMLTTSEQEQDREESYNLGASGYMIKPVDYKKFVEVMRTITVYWTLSKLPPEYDI